MSAFMPLFPLNLIAFPGEQLNLHIFEPRYKELINDCINQKIPFGLPAYINNKIEYGTMMHIVEVYKVYEDGRVDIKTQGEVVIKIERFENPTPGKSYAAGEVIMIENIDDPIPDLRNMTSMIKRLYDKLAIGFDSSSNQMIRTFEIAHKVGLSLEQEYQLLQIPKESDRASFIIDHLTHFIPKLAQAEDVKERIRMNGHFKRLDKLNF